MTFRKIDTCLWRDPWFECLNPNEKLAFIYFWSNDYCNPAGIYEISEKRILFDLGYGIETVFEPLKKKVEWYPEQSTVWVKNFFKHQCQNDKFAKGAINAVKGDKFKLQIFIKHNLKLLESYKIDTNGYGI
ncbi:MAG: hypothetical protein JRI32_04525 [Deltaproteobacteria bacterium]|nr:hypothetical protein [Deltaproteobacteria bacterium]MBW2010918.1 hypothetical protein [Deltaproteobacteria bacterium]